MVLIMPEQMGIATLCSKFQVLLISKRLSADPRTITVTSAICETEWLVAWKVVEALGMRRHLGGIDEIVLVGFEEAKPLI